MKNAPIDHTPVDNGGVSIGSGSQSGASRGFGSI